MTFSDVSSAAYADAGRKSIFCQVVLPGGQTFVPYMAVDGDEDSQEFFNELVAGKHGAVASYVVPTISGDALRQYANSKSASLSSLARVYSLGGDVAVMCGADAATLSNLQGLLAWGSANPTGNTRWVDDNGNVTPLSGSQAAALAHQVIGYWQSLFPVLAEAMDGITSGVIAATSDIDALPWPT